MQLARNREADVQGTFELMKKRMHLQITGVALRHDAATLVEQGWKEKRAGPRPNKTTRD